MSFARAYKCMACGHEKEYRNNETVYVCEKCGQNLEIIYDYAEAAKAINRKSLADNTDMSLWRYSALYPLENGTMRTPLQTGWTPLYKAERLGRKFGHEKVWIKDEGRNPSGSFKDRAGSIALSAAIERKAKRIAGASTGNAGSSMACLCASVGISPVIFVPCKAPKAKIAQLLLYGAKVIAVNGTYDQAFDLCHDACEKYGWFNRNTGYNPLTREGKKSCSMEICEQMGWEVPDWVIVPVGDGNIISGIWKGFLDLYRTGLTDRLPKLCAVQSEKSNAVKKSIEASSISDIKIVNIEASTIADSISVDLPRDGIGAVKAVIESKGVCIEVSDEKILEAIRTAAETTGVFTEPAGATSIAGFEKLAASGILKENETAVCLATGNGLKDIDSALKAAGSPILIEPSVENLQGII